MDTLARNTMGKINKRKLRAPYRQGPAGKGKQVSTHFDRRLVGYAEPLGASCIAKQGEGIQPLTGNGCLIRFILRIAAGRLDRYSICDSLEA